MNYDKFLNMADELALNSPFQTKMGSVIVRRSNVIGKGWAMNTSNIPKRLYQTHSRSSKWDAMHAEMVALRGALYCNIDVRGATVVVSGWTSGGNRPWSCRPCSACVKVLKEWGLKEVVFRLPDGYQVLRVDQIDEELQVCSSCDQSIESWSRFRSVANHR